VFSGGARVLRQGGGQFLSHRAPNFSCRPNTNRFFLLKKSTVFKLKRIGYMLFIKSHEMFNFIIDKNLSEREIEKYGKYVA